MSHKPKEAQKMKNITTSTLLSTSVTNSKKPNSRNLITKILKLPIPAASCGVLRNFALAERILEKIGTHVASYWVFQ
jgi:hypothetical protein